FPIRSDSLPFVKSTPDHHIVHSGGTQQSIEKLKDYLRTESELSSGVPKLQDAQVTPIRRKPSTFSLNVLEEQEMYAHRRNQQPSGGSASNYMLYCNPLLQLADGSVHRGQVLPTFTESTDSLSDETFASQLDGSPPLSRKNSSEHTSNDKMTDPGSPKARSTYSKRAVSHSSVNDTNDIIALYSCKCDSTTSICVSQPDEGSLEPKQKDARHHKKDIMPYRDRYPDKVDLVAIQKLSDKHLFDAASVPLPETPTTMNCARATEPTSQQRSTRKAIDSALSIGQRERTNLDPSTSTTPNLYNLDGMCRLPHSLGTESDLKSANRNEGNRQQDPDKDTAHDRVVKDLLREAEAKHQQEIETLKQEFQRQLSKQSRESQAQIEKYKDEVNELTTERDEMQFMLEEYIATSGRLIEQKESETDVLTHELGKAALERQRLQKSLEECESRADALSSERKEAQERIESLVAENIRLEGLSNDLRNDVLVAEERNELIKKHAQETLDKANAEVSKVHGLLTQAKNDVTSLQTQTSKVNARAKSLQIQLNSTRQQNKDLLDLCERLENSLV
ncbi:hypothetical protein GGI23_003236, partial [Coemansia sp. RSA 2559]